MPAYESGQSPDTDILKMMESAWSNETELQPFDKLTNRLWELGVNTRDKRYFRALVDGEWLEVASYAVPIQNNRGEEVQGIRVVVNKPQDLLFAPGQTPDTNADRVVLIDDYHISLEDGELLHLSSQAECYPGPDNEPQTNPTPFTGPLLFYGQSTIGPEMQVFIGKEYHNNAAYSDMSADPGGIDSLLAQLRLIDDQRDTMPVVDCVEYFEE